MIVITKMQAKILESLERYRYLTNSQLKRLGIGHITRIREATRKLAGYPSFKKPLLNVIRFPVDSRFGRLENVFYLNRHGAEILAEMRGRDLSEIDFTKTTTVFHRDYHHRKQCVDFQIGLDQALEERFGHSLEVLVFDRYFDKSGANRTNDRKAGRLRAKTRADFDDKSHIIPDVNFILQRKDDPRKKALFCLEMTNGKDTKRILRQIGKHRQAMREGILSQKYGLKINCKTLFLFSEKSLMNAVMKRFFEVEDIDKFQNLFYFACTDHIGNNFFNGWQRVGAEGYYNFLNGKKAEFTPEREK